MADASQLPWRTPPRDMLSLPTPYLEGAAIAESTAAERSATSGEAAPLPPELAQPPRRVAAFKRLPFPTKAAPKFSADAAPLAIMKFPPVEFPEMAMAAPKVATVKATPSQRAALLKIFPEEQLEEARRLQSYYGEKASRQ